MTGDYPQRQDFAYFMRGSMFVTVLQMNRASIYLHRRVEKTEVHP